MISISIFLTLIGFEFFYQTSKKAILSRPPQVAYWFGANESLAKFIGFGLLLMALVLSINYLGWGSGIFAFLCMLMMVGSLVVLISPIWKLNISWLFAGFVLLLLIEII
ncbi:hypothetical protein J2X69_002664 [Algoriphagus sp. 4150]|uniref:hypothetical protein n=1 Tax=Algoriphagus sp. 4150 TaxID=2817756 RepID=UPI002856C6CC|nr:hypothetical protein [Algoriphagus sp. 4150]MDR7130314.1 hypothetical protein [Algoriphagus sp. 4150]